VTEDKWLALKMANYYMSDLNWDLSLSNSMFMLLALCPKPKTLLSFVLKAPSSLSFRRKRGLRLSWKWSTLGARPPLYLVYLPPPQFRTTEGPLYSNHMCTAPGIKKCSLDLSVFCQSCP
jgi:hypothetical protein